MFSTGTGRCAAQMYLLAWATELKTEPSQTSSNRNEPCLWQYLRTPPLNDRTLNIPPYLARRGLDGVINFKQGDKLKTYQTPSGQHLSSSFPTAFFYYWTCFWEVVSGLLLLPDPKKQRPRYIRLLFLAHLSISHKDDPVLTAVPAGCGLKMNMAFWHTTGHYSEKISWGTHLWRPVRCLRVINCPCLRNVHGENNSCFHLHIWGRNVCLIWQLESLQNWKKNAFV